MRPVAVALLLAGGCQLAEVDDVPLPDLDYASFVDEVQPVLDEHCANPSCHARPERPLSIYSQRAWRVDPDALHLATPLSDEELRHNYLSCAVMTAEAPAPDETLLLRKSLGERSGIYHGGGEIFSDTRDRDYRALHAWVSGGWRP